MTTRERIKSIPFLGPAIVTIRSYVRTVRERLFWYRFYLRHKRFFKKNRGLRNSHAGKRAFILATGPSIKNQDLKKLAGEYCISVSNFFVHPDFKVIKPTYHLFVMSHSPITEEQWKVWMQDAEKKLPEGQNLLVGAADKIVLDKYSVFKKQNLFYYMFGRKPMGASTGVDFTKRLPNTQTSAQIALCLALYSGATEIYLLGADHDWILHIGESHHFYDEKKSTLMQQGYKEWTTPLEAQFESYLNLWKVYRGIKEYADAREIKIYNATPGSLLDVFPKVKLDDILKQ